MERGPVEVLVLDFPVGRDPEHVVGALRDVVDSGLVRVIDLVLVLRAETGGEIELRDVENDLPPALEWLRLDPHTLLNDDDLTLVADGLPPDRQAAVLALEHVWARDSVQRVRDAGGEVALHARVAPGEADAAFAAAL